VEISAEGTSAVEISAVGSELRQDFYVSSKGHKRRAVTGRAPRISNKIGGKAYTSGEGAVYSSWRRGRSVSCKKI
jgi:hypothetical protein